MRINRKHFNRIIEANLCEFNYLFRADGRLIWSNKNMAVVDDPNLIDYFGDYVLNRAVREGDFCNFEFRRGLLHILDPVKCQFGGFMSKEKLQSSFSKILDKDVKLFGKPLKIAPADYSTESIYNCLRLVDDNGKEICLNEERRRYFYETFGEPLFFSDYSEEKTIEKRAVYCVKEDRIRGVLMPLVLHK